ncbi:MAG: hypothetical protein WKF60_03765 [Ilumatobacter sp.]
MESVPHRVVDAMKQRVACAAIGLMALSACGSGSDAAHPISSAIDSNSGVSPLPAIEVDDVTGDRRVALDAFVPSDRPTLVWFWAPH